MALRSRPSSAARGARPAQGPGATALDHRGACQCFPTTPAHHSQAATAPCPRPQSRHRGRPPAAAARGRVLRGRAPRHHVQSRVQKQKAHSTQPQRAPEISPRAKSTGQGPATKRKHQRAEQRTTKGSIPPLQTSATPTTPGCAPLVVQLLLCVVMNGWWKKESEVVRSQGNVILSFLNKSTKSPISVLHRH